MYFCQYYSYFKAHLFPWKGLTGFSKTSQEKVETNSSATPLVKPSHISRLCRTWKASRLNCELGSNFSYSHKESLELGQILQGYSSRNNKGMFPLQSAPPEAAVGLRRAACVNRSELIQPRGSGQSSQMIKGGAGHWDQKTWQRANWLRRYLGTW